MTSSTSTLSEQQTVLLSLIQEEFKEKVPFHLNEVYACQIHWHDVYSGRCDEVSRRAGVRADLQVLRDAGHIIFINNDGLYKWIQPMTNFDQINETFNTEYEESKTPEYGDVERECELKRMKIAHDAGVIPQIRGEGISVVGDPKLLRKDQIIDHYEAVRLKLPQYYQERHGNDIDVDRVESIKVSVGIEGYLLGVAPLPAVSEIKERDGAKITKPIIGSDGKVKTHVLRNGLHRFVGEGCDFRCQEIDADHEDFLELYGTTANNPSATQTIGVTTKDDAVYAARKWIQRGRLEKVVNDVTEFLKKHYPHVTPSDRIGTVREILELEGVKSSIKPYKQSAIKDTLSSKHGISIENDPDNKIARFAFVLNSSTTIDRYMREVERFQVANPEYQVEVYSSLDNTPSSRNIEVTPTNIREVRRKQKEAFEDSADLNVAFAKLKSKGKVKPIKFVFVQQDNDNEDENSLY